MRVALSSADPANTRGNERSLEPYCLTGAISILLIHCETVFSLPIVLLQVLPLKLTYVAKMFRGLSRDL